MKFFDLFKKKKKDKRSFLIEKKETINGKTFNRYEYDWGKFQTALDSVPNDKFMDVMSRLLDAQQERHAMMQSILIPMGIMHELVLKPRLNELEKHNKL